MDRFKSRKFWIAILTMLVTLLSGGGLDALSEGDLATVDPMAGLIATVVGVVYVLVQGRVDRAAELVKAVGQKLDEKTLEELLRRLRDQDTLPPSAPSKLNPW